VLQVAKNKQPEKPQLGNKDPWALEEDVHLTIEDLINEEPFNHTSDDTGDSVSIGTRVPSTMYRRLVEIRETPGGPYQINSDVMRDAIYLGMRILQLRYKKKDWQIDRKLSSVIDASGAFDRINSQVSDLCKNLEKLKSAEDTEHAVAHLDDFLKEVNNLSENWRKATFVKILKKRGIVTELLSQCSVTAKEVLR
jgi:hypothetical protein